MADSTLINSETDSLDEYSVDTFKKAFQDNKRLEMEYRNLRLLNTIKKDFGSLAAFKESFQENQAEIKELSDFMVSLGETADLE